MNVLIASIVWLLSKSVQCSEPLPHCFANEIHYDVLRIDNERGQVWINVTWPSGPQLPNGDEPNHYWLRYGQVRKHFLGFGNIKVDDGKLESIKGDSNKILSDIELDVQYGIQICSVYSDNESQPNWRELPLQKMKIESRSKQVTCARRVTVNAKSLQAEGVHFEAELQWNHEKLTHDNVWVRWGLATKNNHSDISIVAQQTVHKLMYPDRPYILEDLIAGKDYGVQICSFHDGLPPVENLWLDQKTFEVSFPNIHGNAEQEVQSAKPELTGKNRLALITALMAIAGIFAVAVIATIVCHKLAGDRDKEIIEEEEMKKRPSQAPQYNNKPNTLGPSISEIERGEDHSYGAAPTRKDTDTQLFAATMYRSKPPQEIRGL